MHKIFVLQYVLFYIKLIVKQILCMKLVKQWDKYTEMHGQQNDKYTEMHGQQKR